MIYLMTTRDFIEILKTTPDIRISINHVAIDQIDLDESALWMNKPTKEEFGSDLYTFIKIYRPGLLSVSNTVSTTVGYKHTLEAGNVFYVFSIAEPVFMNNSRDSSGNLRMSIIRNVIIQKINILDCTGTSSNVLSKRNTK